MPRKDALMLSSDGASTNFKKENWVILRVRNTNWYFCGGPLILLGFSFIVCLLLLFSSVVIDRNVNNI